jgi:ankyrin repeat protein
MKGTNKKRVVKVVFPMLALALNSCYFNSSGHIFDAASHNAAVRPSDAKAGHKLWYDGHSYYTYLPRYRYDEKVVTQYSVGGVDDSDGKKHLTLTDDKQFVKLSPSLADYMLGKSQDSSGCAYPADADIADTCSTGYSVTQSVTDDRLCEFKYTSGAAPLWYTLGALNVVCVDIPVTCVENSLASVVMFLTGMTPADSDAVALFHAACKEGDYNAVKNLLDQGVDVDLFHNQTALMVAAEYGHADVCRLLISSGAAVNSLSVKDKKNIYTQSSFYKATALHFAAKNGHLECVKVLCENNAIIDYPSQSGSTPLSLAEVNGHTSVAVYLRNRGAYCDNYNASLSYYIELANSGDAVACAQVGNYYYLNKQYKTAFPYLLKGAEAGYGKTIYYLGLSYFYGYGVLPNDALAKKWLAKAISLGIKAALFEYNQL